MAISTANDVADFFLWYAKKHGDGEPPSNKKIQKLVYYAQAWYLALYNVPLFEDPIEAWIFGPVIPDLYRRFKPNSWNPITDKISKPDLTKEVTDHLVEVYSIYGKYDAWQLERITHMEEPWKKARRGLPPDVSSEEEILQKDMLEYYSKELNG